MADYLQDLVQNIYTKCDMKGFEDYQKGIDSLTKSHKQSIRERIRNNELEQKSQIRLEHYKERYALKTKQLHFQENSLLARKMWLWHRLVRLIGIYFGINTIRNIIKQGSELQLVQKSIEGLTKSTQDWDFIQQQAFKTGTDIEVVARGYRNFFSSARMAGFDKSGIQDMYADLLLSTRAIGATTQQTEGALLALEQMISKGTVSMEELRRQLGNALPGAFEIGAKAMNMTTMEFNKFVRTGKLASAEFVPKFIAQLKKEYAGGFKEISETVDFASKQLRVAWQNLTLEIISGESGKALAKGINELAKLMRSPEFLKFIHILGRIFTLIIKIFTFCIEKAHILITLLGAGGILGILIKYGVILKDIWKWIQLIFTTGLLTNIKILTGELWAMISPIIALYAKILLVISALMLLEDLYTGIFHPEKKSLFGRELSGANTQFGSIAGGEVKNVQEERQKYENLRNKPATISAQSSGWTQYTGKLISKKKNSPVTYEEYMEDRKRQIVPNSGVTTGQAAGIDLDKEETNAYNITMGDVIFQINGAQNPNVIAETINTQFSNLLIGQMGGVTE